MQLTVEVGQVNVVEIDQRQATDPAAHQGFHRIAADTTQPEDGDRSLLHAPQAGGAVEQFEA